jgi:FMNH2-dependent dimethyl sulfone monooxygenase
MLAGIDEATHQGQRLGDSDPSFQFALDVLRKGEALGFDISLVACRWLGADLDTWVLSTALAAQTTRMEIMVAVHPGIIHPQIAAKMGATLDRISGGRFSVNVVNGWNQAEFEFFGNQEWVNDPDSRYQRMDEYVQVLKGIWSQEEFEFSGRFYRCPPTKVPLRPLQVPNPPIYTASRTDAGKDVIAKYCDHWFASYQNDYRAYEDNVATICNDISDLRARAGALGRTLGFGISGHVIIGKTMEDALAQAHELEAHGKTSRVNATAAKALGAGLLGTAETVADRLKRYEDIGVGTVMLHFHPMLDGLDRFADEVMPKLGR